MEKFELTFPQKNIWLVENLYDSKLIKEKLKPLLKDNNHILEQKVLKKNNFKI